MAKRIMVADDKEEIREELTQMVKSLGHQIVAIAENGERAIDLYELSHPDLIFMDITMPVMDGVEAMKKIRETDNDVTIIMLSASGQQAMVIEAMSGGADDFAVKPLDANRIKDVIEKDYEENKTARVERKKTIEQNKIKVRELQTKKKNLEKERDGLGFFSGKRKKQIEDELRDIEREMIRLM